MRKDSADSSVLLRGATGGAAVALALALAVHVGHAAPQGSPQPARSPAAAADADAGSAPASPEGVASDPPPDTATAEKAPPPAPPTMKNYHDALAARRIGTYQSMSQTDVEARVASAEAALEAGRIAEATGSLIGLVEHPRFSAFERSAAGQAAITLLGDAFFRAGAYDAARHYLGRVIATKAAWEARAPYARRAVQKLVELGIESERYDEVLEELRKVPATAPAQIRADIAYLEGRAAEAHGDSNRAIAEYAKVDKSSRYWAQATYLRGLIHVEARRLREGEKLFCAVADPKRQGRSTPMFADSRYFEVRDLARLGLGRIAHEERRHDDARYYYYTVPEDSQRLAAALYESATTRYEARDYESAEELLEELEKVGVHHTYEDEAYLLRAYVELARCEFPKADRTLAGFIRRYEPVRNGARHLYRDPKSMANVLAAIRDGEDPATRVSASRTLSRDVVRSIAVLLKVDPAYATIARRRAVLEREKSGLKFTHTQLRQLQATLSTTGGVVAPLDDGDASARIAGLKRDVHALREQLDELRRAGAKDNALALLKRDLEGLEARVASWTDAEQPSGTGHPGTDLPALLSRDDVRASTLEEDFAKARERLDALETSIAKDALHRLDRRLSRLLRRARLGRIESVLGKKRALEIEIEVIRDGYLPRDAIDSVDAARYLEDDEEYWPFEGDDWPDEFVGGEDAP